MKHIIPLETHVSFEGYSNVYIVSDFTTLLGPCQPDCPHDDGDCYEELYIHVREETRTTFPLSKLKHIFLPNGQGRDATLEEKQGIEGNGVTMAKVKPRLCKPTEKLCVTGETHSFDHVAETLQADHYWCPDCGAYKREPYDDDNVTVDTPQCHSEIDWT